MITASICLSDIPKDRIVEAKNGKKYLNFVVDERRAVSQYGETHTVYLSMSKEERDAKADKIYVGGGKEFVFDNNKQSEPEEEVDDTSPDDLPF